MFTFGPVGETQQQQQQEQLYLYSAENKMNKNQLK